MTQVFSSCFLIVFTSSAVVGLGLVGGAAGGGIVAVLIALVFVIVIVVVLR